MNIPILDLQPQYKSLKDEIATAISRVLESGAFIMGADVVAFEKEVAAFLGVKHAIGMNSGTDALFIGLRALGVTEGDEVITTPFTFFATAEAISHVGATPVFVDINASDFNISPAAIEAAITPRTKAIMPVHLYGNPANMNEIMELAKKHNLKVIEDCAQSFGAKHEEMFTGTIGDVGAYSFFPSKNLGAYGDGGMLVSNDDALAEQARMLRVHGSRKKYYNEVVGYNSRLDSIQAAILRVKLPHIVEYNNQRRNVAQRYNQMMENLPGVITPTISDGHVFHQYTIRITNTNRDTVQKKLMEQGIGTMVYYPVPVHHLPIYAAQKISCPISEELTHQVLSLPIWPELEEATQLQVVSALKQSLE